ncbi:MAG: hypothetical protein JWL71_3229 [Acidobacteria bacterium]|nr:hypothetical protein [Acidobacteriota bacterium]
MSRLSVRPSPDIDNETRHTHLLRGGEARHDLSRHCVGGRAPKTSLNEFASQEAIANDLGT